MKCDMTSQSNCESPNLQMRKWTLCTPLGSDFREYCSRGENDRAAGNETDARVRGNMLAYTEGTQESCLKSTGHTAGGGTPARRLLGDERRALLSAVSLPGRLAEAGRAGRRWKVTRRVGVTCFERNLKKEEVRVSGLQEWSRGPSQPSEGAELASSHEHTKSTPPTLTAEQPLDKSKPHTRWWATYKLGNHCTAEAPSPGQSPGPRARLPSLEAWPWGEEPLEPNCRAGPHRTGGTDFTLNGRTQSLMLTATKGKSSNFTEAWARPTCWSRGPPGGQLNGGGCIREHSYLASLVPRTGPTQQPVGAMGTHSHPSVDRLLKDFLSPPRPLNMPLDPTYPRARTQLHLPVGRHRPLPPGSLREPLGQLHKCRPEPTLGPAGPWPLGDEKGAYGRET
ncbi:hypothetical protein Cadr_000012289 [Camelus dromedarius]|uniref:Uncharacterized protein n=1 Tax=Camelus dromedarius TaxID=9838 RepID=A0A5N4DPX6_CAMDR|nr:hypothetical protein Cadr_000012289 [Camelus dromedarius]